MSKRTLFRCLLAAGLALSSQAHAQPAPSDAEPAPAPEPSAPPADADADAPAPAQDAPEEPAQAPEAPTEPNAEDAATAQDAEATTPDAPEPDGPSDAAESAEPAAPAETDADAARDAAPVAGAPAEAAPPVDAPTSPAPAEPTDVEVVDVEVVDVEVVDVEVVDVEAAGAEDAPANAAAKGVDPIDVTVAGTRVARTAGSAHVIGPEQLERFEYDDPHAALLQVPGVYVRQEDGMGLRPNISLRGVNPDRSKKVTLMEDGVLFGPAPYSAPAAYYFPLVTRMSVLRVVKGPGTIAYGPQTVGGAIDFITRSIPSRTDGTIDVGVGQYGYRKAHAHFGTSTEQVGFLVEGVRLHTDGFKVLDGGGNTGFTRNEWMVKGSYVLDPTADILHTFRLKAGYSDEASNETYLGLTDADFRDNPDRRYLASHQDRMDNHRTQFVLSHQLEVPDRDLSLLTTAYRHDYTRSWNKLNNFAGAYVSDVIADPATNADYYDVLTGEADSGTGLDTLMIGPNLRTFVSQGVQSVLGGRATTGRVEHRFEAGARLHYDSIQRRHSQSGYLVSDGALYTDGNATDVILKNEGETYALALHAIDVVTIGKLDITPGLRMEAIWSKLRDDLAGTTQDHTTMAVLPGLGVFYEVLRGFGVLAGAYRGFSPPPAGQDVEPEYSINYEAGARYSQGRLRGESIAFVNHYSNLTNICTFSNGCNPAEVDTQVNGNAALIYGLELYAAHTPRVGAWGFPVTAAYTFSRSQFLSSFLSNDPVFGNVEKGDELPYIPRHQLNLTAGVEHSAGSLTAGFTYVDRMREGVGASPIDRTVLTDPLYQLDVGGTVSLGEHLEFYANLRNATNYRGIVGRRPYGARPNAPQWFQAGLKGTL